MSTLTRSTTKILLVRVLVISTIVPNSNKVNLIELNEVDKSCHNHALPFFFPSESLPLHFLLAASDFLFSHV